MKDNTEWFAECGWGVFCHWLGAPPSSSGGSELSAEEWNRDVDAFDAQGLADQLAAIGAPYLFITIGQNSGHYLAPNAAYDKHVGIQPSKCSRRDLVSDLYDCLQPHGIKLLVYLPSGAPAADPVAVKALGWDWGFETPWPHRSPRTTGDRQAGFQRKWEEIIREWSERWGNKVKGWWVDGCYTSDDMYRHDDEPNFSSFVAAMKAGNPEAIVAFCPAVTIPVISHTEHEDYTAGELSRVFPECEGPWVERNGHKARYHVLAFLGEYWCKGQPRFPDEFVSGYTKHIISKGGVITWDVPTERSGLMPQAFVKQLTSIRKLVGRHPAP